MAFKGRTPEGTRKGGEGREEGQKKKGDSHKNTKEGCHGCQGNAKISATRIVKKSASGVCEKEEIEEKREKAKKGRCR